MLPLLLAALALPQNDVPAVRAMTFNVRFDNPGDGRDAWSKRWPLAIGVVRQARPDVLGVQEALPHQVAEIASALEGYAHVSLGRDPVEGGGGGAGEACPVYWRTERFDANGTGTFWLSETPGEPSFGWDAACRRVATWVRLVERESGHELLVVNTHFDHRGEEARLESARLVASRLDALRGPATRDTEARVPAVLLGDFNVEPHHDVYTFLERRFDDALLVTESPPLGPTGTFSGFDGAGVTGRRIDYVFVPRGQRVAGYGVVGEVSDGARVPSDHRAVWADLLPWTDEPPAAIHLEGGWRIVGEVPEGTPREMRLDQLPPGTWTLERRLRLPLDWGDLRFETRLRSTDEWLPAEGIDFGGGMTVFLPEVRGSIPALRVRR